MGNNTTATTATSVVETGEFVAADPHTLVIDTNVRTAPTLDKKFVESIATRGVLLPVLATRDDDGTTLRVRDGQLRTLAARDANLATIPVYVISSSAADDAAEVERITDQLVANEQRTDLSNRQRATAFQELLDLGVSATRIAKVTHTTKKAVDAALATASSAAALDAVEQSLTLAQGAILAGYDTDDDTEAVEALLAAATGGRFDHKATELAQRATERALIRKTVAELVEQGYQASAHRPTGGQWHDLRAYYVIDTGQDADELDPASMTREHLHATVDADYEAQWIDADGKPVDEESIDWAVDGEPADVAADPELIDPRALTETEVWAAFTTWYHDDPAVDGLGTWSQRRDWLTDDRDTASDDSAADDGESAAQRAARREAEQKEAEKLERRRTKALNKKAVAAQTVRRDKLREIFGRKTLPKGKGAVVARFLAHTMWTHPDLYEINRADHSTHQVAAELLGSEPLAALDGASAERSQLIALAITCAAHEANLPKDAWRPHPFDRTIGWAHNRDLEFLTEAFGYTLSEVEQVIAGQVTAEAIDIT